MLRVRHRSVVGVVVMRRNGRMRLAMDNVVRSKRVLAALFNVAYLYAYKIKGRDTFDVLKPDAA